jgi:hypothetical protein
MIDRKFEPLVKRLMTQYLGDAEEAEELIMFVVEHLKDHKGPAKLTEGLEPVRLSPSLYPTRTNRHSGPGRGGRGGDDRRLAPAHLREHGVRRRPAHRPHVRRLSPRRQSALRVADGSEFLARPAPTLLLFYSYLLSSLSTATAARTPEIEMYV